MDGVLIIDKPAGITSHDVVSRVRRILGERSVGHTGTLDPFASGVLVILVGRATRLAQFLSGSDKEYEAIIRLGFATDTGDRTGKPLPPEDTAATAFVLSDEEIEAAMKNLRGEIQQVAPMYSAKKQGGRKLYELARRGEQVERGPVQVIINAFTVAGVATHSPAGTTDLPVRVECSAGTYIRTLAEDFGKQLGVGAHLAELRRTRAGNFTIARALTLEQLEERLRRESLAGVVLSPDEALRDLPFVSLDVLAVRRTQQGQPMELESEPDELHRQQNFRMRDELGNLIAVGTYDSEARVLRPRVVLSTQ
jgi:tRNA pseudouridine55 synthase